MGKNQTDDQKIENERLAEKLSEYIGNLDFLEKTKEQMAVILDIPEDKFEYNLEQDHVDFKISPEQVAKISGKQWSDLKELAEGSDQDDFEALFGSENSVMNKFAEFNKNQLLYENINFDPSISSNLGDLPPSNEPQAVDFAFGMLQKSEQTQQLENSSLSSNTLSKNDLDPITEAIRREILAKQRELIASYLVEQEQGAQKKQELLSLNLGDPKAYSEFAKNNENQKKILEALKNEQLKKSLEGVEIAGYKKVHEDFKQEFSPIKWDSSPAGVGGTSGVTTRTQIVKNADGQEIATLTESTHQIMPPVKVKDSKGQDVEVKNYRTIDFPTELEGQNGPMHLSMAVKDQNGKNIALSKAVYFTAHYDDNGKLSEVSSPKPVMFSSTDPDAVGYIEHQGQIYTLPVTQGKYQEMMRALGREEEIGLSKSIDAPELAKDGIMVGMMKTGVIRKEPEISQEEPKKEQKSYVQQQADLELQRQKQYSVGDFEKSSDKVRFLKDLLGSNLSISDKTKYLNEMSNKGYTKEVVGALLSSKLSGQDKNDISRSLLRDASDLDRIKIIEELGQSNDGRKLIIDAFEKGSSKERYDISNAIAESSVEGKTDLTKQVLLVVARPSQESVISDVSKSREGEQLVEEVSKTTSDVNIEEAAKTVDPKQEDPKKEQGKASESLQERADIKANNLRNSLTNPPPIHLPVKKSDKEISAMVKPFSEELDGKNLDQQKNIINTKLDELSKGENALSNVDTRKFLEELLKDRADKRSERVDQIEKGSIKADKDDRAVSVQSTARKTDKDGFPAAIVGKFENAPEFVSRAGSIGLQVYIRDKINQLAPKPHQPHQTKSKEGYTLGSGPKY
jgi:hypothetical protein